MRVCEAGKCTGCNSCINICPKGCISYVNKASGMKEAVIDVERCIHCDLCKSACPVNTETNGNTVKRCYAAWSLDEAVRRNGASGGVATELYRMTTKEDGYYAGVSLAKDFKAVFRLENSDTGYTEFQNSKYVYSDTSNIFNEIGKKLKEGHMVTFIGLPCQVAGLKQYCSVAKVSQDKLYTADLVCHGVTPEIYLQQHVNYLEKKHGKNATALYFRDPNAYTYTYTFTLKNNTETFYAKKVHRSDAYQIGYHYGIAYRDNCYQCEFAKPERQGDITLADFSGVGSCEQCGYDNKNVSCVLVNTEKGQTWMNRIHEMGLIYLEERPIEEEFSTEKRLHSPTPIPNERELFLTEYQKHGDFDKAIKKATKKIIWRNEIRYFFHVEDVKRIVARLLPKKVKKKLKGLLVKK